MTTPAPVQPSEPPQPAPEMIRVNVVCIGCSAASAIWTSLAEIQPMKFVWSPLDNAYLHMCGKCLYQSVPASAPLNIQRNNADQDRTAHHRRVGGGYHTSSWRTR